MPKKHIIRKCCLCHHHLICTIFLQGQLIFIIIGSAIGIFLIFTKNVYTTLCRTSIRCSGISCIAGRLGSSKELNTQSTDQKTNDHCDDH